MIFHLLVFRYKFSVTSIRLEQIKQFLSKVPRLWNRTYKLNKPLHQSLCFRFIRLIFFPNTVGICFLEKFLAQIKMSSCSIGTGIRQAELGYPIPYSIHQRIRGIVERSSRIHFFCFTAFFFSHNEGYLSSLYTDTLCLSYVWLYTVFHMSCKFLCRFRKLLYCTTRSQQTINFIFANVC